MNLFAALRAIVKLGSTVQTSNTNTKKDQNGEHSALLLGDTASLQ